MENKKNTSDLYPETTKVYNLDQETIKKISVIIKKNTDQIQGKGFLKYPGRVSIATLLGVHAFQTDTKTEKQTDKDGTEHYIGVEAKARAICSDGKTISANAFCLVSENKYSPFNSVASKAQTRAISKMLQPILAPILTDYGIESTDADEVRAVLKNKTSNFNTPTTTYNQGVNLNQNPTNYKIGGLPTKPKIGGVPQKPKVAESTPKAKMPLAERQKKLGEYLTKFFNEADVINFASKKDEMIIKEANKINNEKLYENMTEEQIKKFGEEAVPIMKKIQKQSKEEIKNENQQNRSIATPPASDQTIPNG